MLHELMPIAWALLLESVTVVQLWLAQASSTTGPRCGCNCLILLQTGTYVQLNLHFKAHNDWFCSSITHRSRVQQHAQQGTAHQTTHDSQHSHQALFAPGLDESHTCKHAHVAKQVAACRSDKASTRSCVPEVASTSRYETLACFCWTFTYKEASSISLTTN